MTRGNAENNSPRRAIRALTWTTVLLGITLVVHGIMVVTQHWPPGLVTVHGVATLAALTIACALWIARRADERERRAYDTGRAESLATEFDQFETRLRRH